MESQQKSRVNCQKFDDFLAEEVRLEDVSVTEDRLQFTYLVDGESTSCKIRYNSIQFTDPVFESLEKARHFAITLAVLCSLRFGALIPKKINFEKYSRYIDEELLEFLELAMRGHWSQHRYQLGKLAYPYPEFIVTSSELGKEANYPLFSAATVEDPVEVVLASGSGKDGLLCSLILEAAGIKYDICTYFHDTYGDNRELETLYKQVTSHLNYKNQHGVYFNDEYYPWLKNRLERTNVIARAKDYFGNNRFRSEAGEGLLTSMAMTPIQLVYGIPLLIVGHEKSADAPNLIEPESGEAIAHQWTKSFTYHNEISKQMARIFEGINLVSLLKPIHDVKIFDLLFKLDNKLSYATNSCNVQKPWCCKCEKCCYVFAGFCAYGELEKTIAAFGKNLFEMEENLPIWAEILGLKGYIAWECIGLPEEAQLYFYKLYLRGVKGVAISLFEQHIINPLQEKGKKQVEKYFSEIEKEYSKIYENHHTMPDWLWQRIQPILSKV
jgi:hypothetical protein